MPLTSPAIYEAPWHAGLYAHTWHRRRVGLFLATPPRARTGVIPERHANFRAFLGDLWAELAGNDLIRCFEYAQIGGAVALAEAFAHGYAGPGGIIVAAMNDAGERAIITLMPT